jgi:hypothetical protein
VDSAPRGPGWHDNIVIAPALIHFQLRIERVAEAVPEEVEADERDGEHDCRKEELVRGTGIPAPNAGKDTTD